VNLVVGCESGVDVSGHAVGAAGHDPPRPAHGADNPTIPLTASCPPKRVKAAIALSLVRRTQRLGVIDDRAPTPVTRTHRLAKDLELARQLVEIQPLWPATNYQDLATRSGS
jgi:hypothetical protein